MNIAANTSRTIVSSADYRCVRAVPRWDAGESERPRVIVTSDNNEREPSPREIANAKFFAAIWDFTKPAAEGLAVRATYLALSDNIVLDNIAVQKALTKVDSPVAQQLLQRWNLMEDQGWTISRRPSLHVNFGASYIRDKKQIAYCTQTSFVEHLFAGPSRVKEAVGQVSHELSHHDGHNWYPIASGNADENIGMAKRILATEARACIVDAHISQAFGKIQSRTGHTLQTIDALKKGNLGQYIYETWPNWNDNFASTDKLYANHPNPQFRYINLTYPEFRFLTAEQARDHVNQYIKTTFGDDIIDHKTGKIRPIDINAGIGEMNAPLYEGDPRRLPFGDGYRWQAAADAPPIKAPFADSFDRGLGKTHRALYALGTVAALTQVSDVHGAFHKSYGSGMGRIGKVAANFTAFELGMRASNLIVGRNVRPLRGLACAIGAGIVSAHVVDSLYADKLEDSARNYFD